MIENVSRALADSKNRDLALVVGGMLGIMTGAKATPLAMFAVGARGLERHWRKANPDVDPAFAARWKRAIEFYDATHQDRVNRVLHIVGIPMIVGGVVGMIAAPRWTPPWWIANGSWTAGWILNFIGHGLFEKGAPAFADDPLSFIAGPVWDFMQVKKKLDEALGNAPRDEAGEPSPIEAAAAA